MSLLGRWVRRFSDSDCIFIISHHQDCFLQQQKSIITQTVGICLFSPSVWTVIVMHSHIICEHAALNQLRLMISLIKTHPSSQQCVLNTSNRTCTHNMFTQWRTDALCICLESLTAWQTWEQKTAVQYVWWIYCLMFVLFGRTRLLFQTSNLYATKLI